MRLERIPGVSVCCHVPILGRCVDLVYVVGDQVMTVEFKLHAWRRAIEQARDHRLAADRAYVCMPRRKVSDEFRAELCDAGVGLFFYAEGDDWPFETVVEAPESEDSWPVARSDVLNYVCANGGNRQ